MTITLHLTPTTESGLAHLRAQIRAIRGEDPLQPIHLLLPSMRAIRAVRRELGSSLGVELNQFYGLGQRVLDAAGVRVHELSDTAIRRLVRSILAQMAAAGELTSFAAVHQTNGFVDLMIRWLREMKGQRISPEAVAAEAEQSGLARDRQLATLYRRYQHFLQTRRLSDTEGLLWLAVERLEREEALFRHLAPFFIFGFDQFTPVQLDFLAQLCGRFARCDLYLLWDEARPADSLVLSRLNRTRQEIVQRLAPQVETLPAPAQATSPLGHLRRSLLETDQTPLPVNDSALRAVEAPSPEEEVRWALRQIKRLLLAGTPPDQIALLAPHPQLYAPTVRTIAVEYGVPIAIDQPLSEIPAVTALLALLDLAPAFPRRQTLDALRSTYIRQGWLSPTQIDALDRITRQRPVIAGRGQWLTALRLASAAATLDEDARDDPTPSAPAAEIDALSASLTGFFDHLTPPPSATHETYALWLQTAILGMGDDEDEALEESGVSLHFLAAAGTGDHADRDLAALALVMRALRSLIVAVDLVDLTAPTVDWPTFLAEVRAALAGILLPPDPAHAQIIFDALEAGRAAPVDHLLVLGLSEGEFPQPPAPDPLYAPHEREGGRLPLRVRETGEEASLWWQILSNCRRTLTLLRPRLDESGAEWSASPYYDAALAAFEDAPVEEIPIAPHPAVEDAACAGELLVALAAGNPTHLPADLHPLWQQAHAGLTISRLRQGWQDLGIYEGCLDAADLRVELDDRFGPHHRWSASRLSRYASCPAGFFAEQVLALDALADPVEGMDVLVRGSLIHELLERLGGALAQDGVSVCAANRQEILARLDAVCAALFPTAPQRYGFAPDLLWAHEQAELRRLLSSLVDWECEENGDAPRFHPFKQEVRFGLHGRPPLRLTLPNGESLLVGGVVDRIDRDADGNLRLIDYKSGSTLYSSRHLLDGTAIQTALYALAVEEILGEEGRVVESSYWHVASRKRSGELQFAGAVRDHADVQGMLAQLARMVLGVRQGRFPSAPVRPQDGGSSCRRDCELAPFCRVSRLTIAKARRAAEG